ncbi:replicative DNA helicase [Oceanobacillus caeni]
MINNIHAEQAVIGTILFEGTLFDSLIVSPEHFYDPRLKLIFNSMQEVSRKEQAINIVTVTSELGDDINQVGGVTYLTQLAESIPSAEALKNYEHLVLEAYRNRKSKEMALRYAENPDDESLELLVKELEGLKDIGVQQQEKTTYEHLQEIALKMMDPPEESGFLTGYSDFDHMTGGTQPSDLIIIAARPSVGKTAFALNIGAGHCRHEGTTHIFSLEMRTEQLLQRMISSEANVDGQKWKSMNFSTEDYEKATHAIGTISSWDLNIYENATTINDIKAKIRKAVTHKPEEKHLVIIDYLQLIRTTGRYERRDLEVGSITRDLKLLARDLNIPIILLSQLSRGVEQRQDKRPMMSDLRESGNIEQDADVVGFLYRDDYYNKESEKQNIIEIILSKQRNGPTGTIELAFLKEYGKFLDLDLRYSRLEGE